MFKLSRDAKYGLSALFIVGLSVLEAYACSLTGLPAAYVVATFGYTMLGYGTFLIFAHMEIYFKGKGDMWLALTVGALLISMPNFGNGNLFGGRINEYSISRVFASGLIAIMSCCAFTIAYIRLYRRIRRLESQLE